MRREVRDARLVAKLILAVALATAPVTFLMWAAAPGGFRPMFYEPPWYEYWLPVVGIGGWLFGLGWMIRIYRADPEAGERSWRFRD